MSADPTALPTKQFFLISSFLETLGRIVLPSVEVRRSISWTSSLLYRNFESTSVDSVQIRAPFELLSKKNVAGNSLSRPHQRDELNEMVSNDENANH